MMGISFFLSPLKRTFAIRQGLAVPGRLDRCPPLKTYMVEYHKTLPKMYTNIVKYNIALS